MSFEVLFAIGWAVILGAAGGLLTSIGPWYRNLKKPSWQPPDWLFGPAWTLILGLAAWALVLAWRETGTEADRTLLLALYAINFAFHFLWSPLFFKLRRPDWAMLEVPFLWASVLAMCVLLRDWSPIASWMIAPYLAWVSFAAVLNWKIVRLNGPFGARLRRQDQ